MDSEIRYCAVCERRWTEDENRPCTFCEARLAGRSSLRGWAWVAFLAAILALVVAS